MFSRSLILKQRQMSYQFNLLVTNQEFVFRKYWSFRFFKGDHLKQLDKADVSNFSDVSLEVDNKKRSITAIISVDNV